MPKDRASNVVSMPGRMAANPHRLGYVGRKPASQPRDADAWFTPQEYLDSVRSVIGPIALDPFSSEVANKIVGATQIFSTENSAFENEWLVAEGAGVFMNPPYSSGLCARAVNRFIDQFELDRFSQGIVLVNNATDTRWFVSLAKRSSAICFTDHRISFWNADGKRVSGNTRGQAFLYFGTNPLKFSQVFDKHGLVTRPL